MNSKKDPNKARAELPKPTGDARSTGATASKASRLVAKAVAQSPVEPNPEDVAKNVERQTLRAFLDAVDIWRLNAADVARLVGAEPASVESWRTGKTPISEQVLTLMTMVALIRTALDVTFSPALANEWMTLPNSGYPYLGLSPVAYVGEHGWPGLFWVLRQCQARAVGN